MALTHSQYSKFKDHQKLQVIRYKVERNHAIDNSSLKNMITQAIESAYKGRTTEDNIEFVAKKCGAFYRPHLAPRIQTKCKVQGILKTEVQVRAWVKSKLPDNAHGDVSKCVNNLLLERDGKSCIDVTGKSYNNLRHCSSGRVGAAGGCTLFYIASNNNQPANLLAVGQHNNNHKVSYTILEKGSSGLPNELILKK